MSDAHSDMIATKNYLMQLEESLFFKDEKTEGSLNYYIAFYRRLAPKKRHLFQGSGVIVIVLSTSLPLVAAFGERLVGDWNNLIIALIGVAIAILSGLNAFFHWDTGWRGQIGAQLELQRLRAEWQAKRAAALTHPNHEEGFVLIQTATDKLISSAHQVIKTETNQFFEGQRFPESKSEDNKATT